MRTDGTCGVVAANIRGILASRGITITTFARTLGWDRQRLYKRLDGRNRFTLDDLDLIAYQLAVPVVALVEPGRDLTGGRR